MDIKQAFGLTLKFYRLENSLSQEKLAHICNLDRTYISLLERGKRNPTITTLFTLASALNIKPIDLILKTEKLLKED